jgi:hypothetical protein
VRLRVGIRGLDRHARERAGLGEQRMRRSVRLGRRQAGPHVVEQLHLVAGMARQQRERGGSILGDEREREIRPRGRNDHERHRGIPWAGGGTRARS